MKTFPITYMNLVEFHKDLALICPDYDPDASIRSPQFTFVTKDGKNHFGSSFVDFINKLKNELKVPVTYEGSYITRVITVNYTEDIKDLVENKKELGKEVKKPATKLSAKKPLTKTK